MKIIKAIAGCFAALLIVGACSAAIDGTDTSSGDDKTYAERQTDERAAKTKDAGASEVTAEATATPKPKPTPTYTAAQENAIASAENYLDFTAFSREGLIEQLVFEDYSKADATFAVNHIEVDWNEQAAAAAKDYLDYSSFSRQGLIDQLTFEGYTVEQATHGVNQTGL